MSEQSIFDRRVTFDKDWEQEPTIREIMVQHYCRDLGEDQAGDAVEMYIDGLTTLHAASNEAKIAALTKALYTARRQLITLGGDHRPYPDVGNSDIIQGAVLDDIDAALSSHTEQEGLT